MSLFRGRRRLGCGEGPGRSKSVKPYHMGCKNSICTRSHEDYLSRWATVLGWEPRSADLRRNDARGYRSSCKHQTGSGAMPGASIVGFEPQGEATYSLQSRWSFVLSSWERFTNSTPAPSCSTHRISARVICNAGVSSYG